MSLFRRVGMVATVGLALAGVVQVPASAGEQFAPDKFKVCLTPSNCGIRVEGTIVWGQRSASIKGTVYNNDSANAEAVAQFEAEPSGGPSDYASARALIYEQAYSVVIGDPNRVGGINKIYTRICRATHFDGTKCSTYWLDIRD